jgi:hypothetical protein
LRPAVKALHSEVEVADNKRAFRSVYSESNR